MTSGVAPAPSATIGRPAAAHDCMPPATLTADTPCWDRKATTRADRAPERQITGVGCVARGPLVVFPDVEQHGAVGEVGHADRGDVHGRILARPPVTPG